MAACAMMKVGSDQHIMSVGSSSMAGGLGSFFILVIILHALNQLTWLKGPRKRICEI